MLHDSDNRRVGHALQTFAIVLKNLSKKRFTNFGLEVLHLVFGIDVADAFMAVRLAVVCLCVCGPMVRG